jgi:hypothetical protein
MLPGLHVSDRSSEKSHAPFCGRIDISDSINKALDRLVTNRRLENPKCEE